MDETAEPLSAPAAAAILARARRAQARLRGLVDRLVARNLVLDPELLEELGRFLEEEGYAAAAAYRRLIEAAARPQREDPAPALDRTLPPPSRR